MFYSPAPLILQTDCFYKLEYPPLRSCITCSDQEVTTACRAQSNCELSHEAAINHIQPLQFKANEIFSAVPQSHRAAFQGLNCHMWLVATALNDRCGTFPSLQKNTWETPGSDITDQGFFPTLVWGMPPPAFPELAALSGGLRPQRERSVCPCVSSEPSEAWPSTGLNEHLFIHCQNRGTSSPIPSRLSLQRVS